MAVACCGFEFCCFVYCGVGVLFAVGQAIVVLLMLMVLGCLLFICGLLCGYCGYVSVCGLFAVWGVVCWVACWLGIWLIWWFVCGVGCWLGICCVVLWCLAVNSVGVVYWI